MLATALLAVLLIAQADKPEDVCSFCKGKGLLPCKEHSTADVELETNVAYCTVACDCGKCRGTLFVDCEKCALGDAEWKKRVAEKEKWLAALKPHLDLFGRRLRVAQSKHFEVTWDGGTATVGKRSISEHAALHLYVDRCESVYSDFTSTFGCDDSDFSTRFRVMIWDRYKDHQKAGANYCSQANPDTSVKRVGAVGIYSVYLDPSKVDPDENAGADLHRNLVHNVAHLLLANAWNARWLELQGGWVDEGVAHWFEDRLDRRCTNFCYREQDSTQSFKGGRWRGPVKALAFAKDRPPFADTAAKRPDELSLAEHALSWSYCEFLIARNPKGFAKICRAIKEGKSYRDALKSEFSWNALEFEEEWKKHVKTYPPK